MNMTIILDKIDPMQNIGTGIVIIILLAGIIFFFYMLGNKRKKQKECKHDFEPKGHFVCKETPRLLERCKKCGVAIHVPIYTMRRLREVEDARRNQATESFY